MLKDENIICISSIDWDFVWQGHQEIMSAFARNGNRVLFIENTGIRVPSLKDIPRLKKRIATWLKSIKGFRKEMDNLYVYSPIILPFPYSRIVGWLNRHMLIPHIKRWMKIVEFYEPIIWTFLPTRTALDIIKSIDRKLLIYYCIADFYELADNPKKVKKTENELIKKCDLIFTQGEVLKEKCRRLNECVHIFPFGVNMEVFCNLEYNINKVPFDIKEIEKPIIGYIGGIHKHIDFELIRFIVKTHPGWAVVLVGPVQTDISKISGLGNVFLLGKKDFLELPNYIMEFDVGIIPYEINEYTATVFPTKLNEYHIMGKPVVSTNLPEVNEFNAKNDNLVLVGKTYQEFVEHVSKVIISCDKDLFNKRILSARKNSWAVRIEEMSDLIEEALEIKDKALVNWQEKLLKLYKLTRRKIFSITIPVLVIYVWLFYTPFVWFLAKPLQINQMPQKADCIVVFAGGVGESGKPAQGYEERIKQAVSFYKKGYAKYLIFSSGYRFIFNETLMMKALAVSLGVPENAVILEDKAVNTYENVEFTKDILHKEKWDDILLISSPYHMRRVFLVFNKIAKEIRVTYTPLSNSAFYAHENRDKHGRRIWKRIKLQQIKAIVHEYFGIMYYWWKGRI